MPRTLDDHAAPGQAAGYAYQFDLALLFLSEGQAGNSRVGIETLDDVAVLTDDAISLAQAKTSTVGSEPFADGAFGLWNALHVWCDAIKGGEVDAALTSFHLVSNTSIPDCLARRLSEAVELQDIHSCISMLRRVPAKPSKRAAPHVLAVRAMADDVLVAVIRQIKCEGMQEGMDLTALRFRIAARLKLPADIEPEHLTEELAGWVKAQAQKAWNARLPAWIEQQHFNTRLHAAIARHRRATVRELPARLLVCTQEDLDHHRGSTFVRQLEIIDLEPAAIVDSISDYLRHGTERLRLTSAGEVDDDDWTDFDNRLVEFWKPVFRTHVQGAQRSQHRAIGRVVFEQVQQHREDLAGHTTSEYYLTRGGLHRLADLLQVGWHPTFLKRCRKA